MSEDLWLSLTARPNIRKIVKKVKRTLLFLTTIILTLAGCASEDYVGNEELHEANENGRPVSFDLVAAHQTRSQSAGSDAASELNKNFVIWGEKTLSDNTTIQTVFNNYQVNYVSNSANTTISNTSGWEYVGYTNRNGIDQSIKYWDYSASKYDFFASSLGRGDNPETPASSTYATASAMTQGTYSYTLEGTKAQLSTCYLSDLKEMSPSNQTVVFTFRNMMAKVKVAFYETIPGYSVTKAGLKFYSSSSTDNQSTPYLYDDDDTPSIPDGDKCKYTVRLNTTTKKPELTLETDYIGYTPVANIAFGALSNYAERDYNEDSETPGTDAAKLYLARSSNMATLTPEVSVLPNPDGTTLTMKLDYTLLARDGNTDKIEVKGATATVPAQYAQWQPNYSYTYIFKISDNTNGSTGQSILGLSPITLDAVVTQNPDGRQETVTTITNPSITTYQYGSNVVGTDEYYYSSYVVEGTHTAGPVYIVVYDNSPDLATLITTGDGVNAKLYTAEIEEGAAQGITESSVANALEKGTQNPTGTWTFTDSKGKKLTMKAVTSGLTPTNEIAAVDSPDGKAIVFHTVASGDPEIYKAVKFTPTAEDNSTTYYVFEYIDNTDKKYYKVIKVKGATTTPTP